MVITVKLFAQFRHGRFKEAEQDLPPGADCRHVLERLGLGPRSMGIVLVNGRHAGLDQLLQDRDTLSLFPLVGGG
jgi:molybdopterin converting factor small subunit